MAKRKVFKEASYTVDCNCGRDYYTEFKSSVCPYCGRTNGGAFDCGILIFGLAGTGVATIGGLAWSVYSFLT